ncbi:MAG TPA: hypothetical protein VEJ88_01195 [Dissulfurispiraceae bacterium]|nr:hypothetical protein [Dissulfurispiraceae bacterium]
MVKASGAKFLQTVIPSYAIPFLIGIGIGIGIVLLLFDADTDAVPKCNDRVKNQSPGII